MKTHCNQQTFRFQTENTREVVAHFNGGTISSDAQGLLLQQTERDSGSIAQVDACFTDYSGDKLTEHSVKELIAQRIYAIALGYEELNDHDQLRIDPLLAVLVGKKEPTGKNRVHKRDAGKPLAGKSTLNRLELTPVRAGKRSRYKKVTVANPHFSQLFCFSKFSLCAYVLLRHNSFQGKHLLTCPQENLWFSAKSESLYRITDCYCPYYGKVL